MRRWIKGILVTLLLAGGVIICIVRWQAWFGMPAEQQWNDTVSDYIFPSPCDSAAFHPFDNDSTLTILVLGDVHNRLTRSDYDTLARRVPQADLVVQVGDWMDRGQFYYRQLLLREWTNSSLYGLPVITTPGNHEYSKGLHKTLSTTWSETFSHPNNGPKSVPGASYYIDLPAVRFITIDTNPLNRLTYLTRTLTWLREAMFTASDRFVVVMMHHPVLSAAKGRANVLVYSTFRYALGDADLVLAGHDHSYMRRTPFVVLNTAGRVKEQRFHYTPEVTDTVPVYGVLRIANLQSQISNIQFNVYRLDDNTLIDSLHVSHE